MADPLDYRNPKQPPSADGPRCRAQAVIPVEFDLVLIRSEDLPVVRAIEAALRHKEISFYTSHDGWPARRVFELHIQCRDREQAGEIAAKALATRETVKSIPGVEMPRDIRDWPIGMDITSYIP